LKCFFRFFLFSGEKKVNHKATKFPQLKANTQKPQSGKKWRNVWNRMPPKGGTPNKIRPFTFHNLSFKWEPGRSAPGSDLLGNAKLNLPNTEVQDQSPKPDPPPKGGTPNRELRTRLSLLNSADTIYDTTHLFLLTLFF
jgi:hypothetical protein